MRRTQLLRIAAELEGLLYDISRLAADKSPTEEGAKKLFERYKRTHPGTKKSPKDFFDPNASDEKKSEEKPEKKPLPKNMKKDVTRSINRGVEQINTNNVLQQAMSAPEVVSKAREAFEKGLSTSLSPSRATELVGKRFFKKEGIDTSKPPSEEVYGKVEEALVEALMEDMEKTFDSIKSSEIDAGRYTHPIFKTLKESQDSAVNSAFEEGVKNGAGWLSKYDTDSDPFFQEEVDKAKEEYMKKIDEAKVQNIKLGLRDLKRELVLDVILDDFLGENSDQLQKAVEAIVEANFDL